MSTLTFDERELENRLSSLSSDGRLAFGLLCCERMIPNYVAFFEESSWGDPVALRKTLDACWEEFVGERSVVDWTALEEGCNKLSPDTEEFQTILVSSALDAVAAITVLIDLFNTRDVEYAVSIASLARDTVDMYVQEVEDMLPNAPSLEEKIRVHSLMQNELQAQENDLERVCGMFDKNFLKDNFCDKRKSSIASI